MISHHCSVCGEEVTEFCAAHPSASVDSAQSTSPLTTKTHWKNLPCIGIGLFDTNGGPITYEHSGRRVRASLLVALRDWRYDGSCTGWYPGCDADDLGEAEGLYDEMTPHINREDVDWAGFDAATLEAGLPVIGVKGGAK